MNVFRSRLHDRVVEAMEWLDYRRDAGLWPFLLLPPLLSIAWAYGGAIGLGIVVAFGVGVAVLALGAAICGIGLWIVGNATLDATRTFIDTPVPRRRVPATSR